MKLPWKRTRGAADRPEAAERPIMPERTKWLLTRCKKCGKVSWWGQPIPHVAMSKEPTEQLVRVRKAPEISQHSPNRSATKRVVVSGLLRLVMSRPEKRKWRCPACGSTECGVATEASHILALTLNAMRGAGS